MKTLLCLFAVLAVMSMATAQRVETSTGDMLSIRCNGDVIVYIDDNEYRYNDDYALIYGLNLLVTLDVTASNHGHVQIGIYIVECDNQQYSIWLDERCANQEGYPMYFETIEDVKGQLMECLHYDLSHDYNHEYDPDGYFLEGH